MVEEKKGDERIVLLTNQTCRVALEKTLMAIGGKKTIKDDVKDCVDNSHRLVDVVKIVESYIKKAS